MLARDEEVPVVAQAAAIKAATPTDSDGSNPMAVCIRRRRGRRSRDTDSMSDSSGRSSGARGTAFVLLCIHSERDGDQQLLHARNFGGLIDVDVGRELEDGLVLTGAV